MRGVPEVPYVCVSWLANLKIGQEVQIWHYDEQDVGYVIKGRVKEMLEGQLIVRIKNEYHYEQFDLDNYGLTWFLRYVS